MSKALDIADYGQFQPVRKNLIINGNFNVAQRGVSSSPMGNGTYLLDRWKYGFSGGVMVSDHLQIVNNAVPEGQSAYYRINVTTVDTSIAVGDQSHLQQLIEGYNIIPLGWHLAAQGSKKPLTISFWTAHTKTGIHCVSIRNGDTSRSYVAEYTQAVADTWEKHTVTVPAPTDGTWLVNNAASMSLAFTQVSGSTYHTTKDTWQTGNYIATSSQVNNFDSTANFIRYAGVQVEVGSEATDFEHRPFAEELALCQRYYEKSYDYGWYAGQNIGTGSDRFFITGLSSIAHGVGQSIGFAVQKRAVPTISLYSTDGTGPGNARDGTNASNVAATPGSIGHTTFFWNATMSAVSTQTNMLVHWTADAEL